MTADKTTLYKWRDRTNDIEVINYKSPYTAFNNEQNQYCKECKKKKKNNERETKYYIYTVTATNSNHGITLSWLGTGTCKLVSGFDKFKRNHLKGLNLSDRVEAERQLNKTEQTRLDVYIPTS